VARFQKGQSGNPRGRPKGVATQQKLRESISKDLPEIIAALTVNAKQGDTTAAKLLMDRVLAPVKPVDPVAQVALSGRPSDAAKGVLEAISKAQVSPDQGVKLISGIASYARILEVDDLLRRVEALEEAKHEKPE